MSVELSVSLGGPVGSVAVWVSGMLWSGSLDPARGVPPVERAGVLGRMGSSPSDPSSSADDSDGIERGTRAP